MAGLRERKRARTEREILKAATKAFVARGYQNVTLDEIAEAAEVHKRTVLRYFPTKAHLILHVNYAELKAFRDEMNARGDLTAIDVWERHVRYTTAISRERKYHQEISEIIESDAILSAEMLRISRNWQEIIASALERDLQAVAAPELASKVAAAALVAGNSAVYRSLVQRGVYAERAEELFEVVSLIRGLLFPPCRQGGQP